jgi:nitroreductase
MYRASRSASGGNVQSFHVYVLRDEARDQFCQGATVLALSGVSEQKPMPFAIYPPKKASEVYMARRREVAAKLYDLMQAKTAEERNAAVLRNFVFFDAPVGMIITVDRIMDKNSFNHAGLFLAAFELLAMSRGLSICFQEAWVNFEPYVLSTLNIPKEESMVCGVAVGYADPSNPANKIRTNRRSVDEIAKFISKL